MRILTSERSGWPRLLFYNVLRREELLLMRRAGVWCRMAGDLNYVTNTPLHTIVYTFAMLITLAITLRNDFSEV
jgi:hypothetical protein